MIKAAHTPTPVFRSAYRTEGAEAFFKPRPVTQLVMREVEEAATQMDAGEKSGDAPGRSKQRAAPAACISLVSFTVTPSAPVITTAQRGSCTMKMGNCPTSRGQCGTAGTGMVMQATVRAPEGCQGQLAFAQNTLSVNRRRTRANGTNECLVAGSAHADGSIPWKGCVVDVNAPGDHTITSDDCPDAVLQDTMTGSTVSDQFKTFLLWKPQGDTHRRPFANARWSWGGTASRQGTSGDCDQQWQLSNLTHVSGTGALSSDMPVATPRIRDIDYGACTP